MVPFSKALRQFDSVFFIGEMTGKQYPELKTKKGGSFVPNTGFDFLYSTGNLQKGPKSFLFLGSAGQVFRGLDLVLEAFAKEPELQLYVCGPFLSESDFCELYRKELFSTPNIHPIGYIDVESSQFRELCERCAYSIYPTCAESQSGSVLVAMSAGVIPIATKVCGVSGIHYLPSTSIPAIRREMRSYSQKSPQWVDKEAKRMQQIVKQRYSREAFLHHLEKVLRQLL
jgi:glycosyltransferase involved in cell wall biosynthesis